MNSCVLVPEPAVREGWICRLRLRQLCSFPVLLGVLIVGLAFLAIHKSNADPDIGWHLRNAQYQLQHHAFLRHDPYSFTTRGKPWMDDEWLGEMPLYLAWSWFGPRGIFFVTFASIVTILLGVFGLATMRSGNVKSAFLVSVFAVILASVSYGPRTLLFGWIFLVIELAILYRFHQSREGRLLWALPPLFAIWVNTHGSWIIGFVLLGMFAVCGCVQGRWGSIEAERWSRSEMRNLAWVIGLATLALFVNPYGWRLPEYPFDMAFQQKLNIANVTEWRTLNFHMLRGKLALLLLLGGIAVQLGRRRKWALYEVAFLLLAIYSGFTYSRFLFLIVILAIPFLAEDVAAWMPPYRAERDRPWLNGCFILACLIGIAVKFPTDGHLRRSWSNQYPVEAEAYLKNFHPAGHVLTDYLWGGYLIWNVRQIPVFVDSRVDIFEHNGVFLDYLHLEKLQGTLGILDKYSIRYVLYQKKTALSYLLEHTPGWKVDYQDGTTILFERAGNVSMVRADPARTDPGGAHAEKPVGKRPIVSRASLRLPIHRESPGPPVQAPAPE